MTIAHTLYNLAISLKDNIYNFITSCCKKRRVEDKIDLKVVEIKAFELDEDELDVLLRRTPDIKQYYAKPNYPVNADFKSGCVITSTRLPDRYDLNDFLKANEELYNPGAGGFTLVGRTQQMRQRAPFTSHSDAVIMDANKAEIIR